MRRCAAALSAFGFLGLLEAVPAAAGECLSGSGNPVPHHVMAYGLSIGGSGDIPGQLSGQPFSVISLEQANVSWSGCADSCVTVSYQGESQCGNLVENPVDFYAVAELVEAGIPDYAFSEVGARYAANGKWETRAVAYLSPDVPATYSANYTYDLGTREVIDVTSTATGVQPLRIRLLAGGQFGIQQCIGDLYHVIPSASMRFRVTERDANFIDRKLVERFYDYLFASDEVFTIEVKPNVTLYVDVYLRVGSLVHTQNFHQQGPIFIECWGATSTLDFEEGPEDDGIQLFFTPAETLTLAPRSGIVYETAPEVESSAAAIAMLLGLAAQHAGRKTS
jgi:hypothetical protein